MIIQIKLCIPLKFGTESKLRIMFEPLFMPVHSMQSFSVVFFRLRPFFLITCEPGPYVIHGSVRYPGGWGVPSQVSVISEGEIVRLKGITADKKSSRFLSS